MKTIPVSQLAHLNAAKGGHWFDPGVMAFFDSILADLAYVTADGGRAYFVSNDKGPNLKRAWSVREFTFADCNVRTVGEFQQYGSAATAEKYAKQFAAHVPEDVS